MAVAAGMANMEIQTTIRDFPKKIGGLNVSPETPIRVFLDIQVISEEDAAPDKPKKSKWAEVAERISKESPLRGVGEELRKASREFRDNFHFREPPYFENIKTDD